MIFGAEISVLLMGDRFLNFTDGLRCYLQSSTDITVYYAADYDSALKAILEKPYNFLLIIGELKNRDSYNVVADFNFINKYSNSIGYALMSPLFY
ncbi:MAG: hypothetical protein FWE20_11830 [Defluviitaleaceae bacterium]|nr:hypothetical protein [Defluviitaleaceae bacterium]